jgi:hypothetical protein
MDLNLSAGTAHRQLAAAADRREAQGRSQPFLKNAERAVTALNNPLT